MSRSLLHDWECDIERLGGDNANALLDIAQDIYNTGYVRGKNYELSVLEDIKEELNELKSHYMPSSGVEWGIKMCLEIIDKRIESEG